MNSTCEICGGTKAIDYTVDVILKGAPLQQQPVSATAAGFRLCSCHCEPMPEPDTIDKQQEYLREYFVPVKGGELGRMSATQNTHPT